MTQDEWLDDFAFNLRALIGRSGLSQKELSIKSGIKSPNISRYLNGTQKPTVQNVVNLAYALECDVSEIIDMGEPIEEE